MWYYENIQALTDEWVLGHKALKFSNHDAIPFLEIIKTKSMALMSMSLKLLLEENLHLYACTVHYFFSYDIPTG
jgi:hypothetical protein